MKKIETSTGFTFLREDGIIQTEFNDSIILTKECVIEYIKAYKEFCEDGPKPILTLTGKNSTATYDARDFFAKDPEALSYRSAEAYVVNTVFHKFLADFYMKFQGPKTPCKVFDNTSDAIEWLKKYL